MPDWNWQTILALLIVAGAVCALARRVVRLVRGSSGGACGTGGCGSCPSGESSAKDTAGDRLPLVSLGEPNSSADGEGGRSGSRAEDGTPASGSL